VNPSASRQRSSAPRCADVVTMAHHAPANEEQPSAVLVRPQIEEAGAKDTAHAADFSRGCDPEPPGRLERVGGKGPPRAWGRLQAAMR
jgi:hypothetical protein